MTLTYYKSKERLPRRFNICHPNCRHRLTPVPEEVLGGVSAMQAVKSDDLLRNLPASQRLKAIKNTSERMQFAKQQVAIQEKKELILDNNRGSIVHTEADRIQAYVSGKVDISRLDNVSQHIVANVVKDIYLRYPNIPKVKRIEATQRGLMVDGDTVYASSDNGILKLYPEVHNFEELKKRLQIENKAFAAKYGRDYSHYRTIGDIINHEFGHIVTESSKDVLERFMPYIYFLEKSGLMSWLMKNDMNEFFPELFLLYRQRRLNGDLRVIANDIEIFMQEAFG